LPQYKMLWLIESRPRFFAFLKGTNPSSLIKKTRKYKLDGINIGDSMHLTERIITRLKSAGLLVYTWTINDPIRAKQLDNMGVDAITTDKAAWMKQQLIENSSPIY
jgi:glycerophosphoryl diester phosphodiesterase